MSENFNKYPSLVNSYHTGTINKIRCDEKLSAMDWCVFEKVHGSNFSFNMTRVDDESIEIKTASRSGFTDNFQNSKELVDKYRDSLERILIFYEATRKSKEVTVFGELYGGVYPHENVDAVKNERAVQGGVFYCPNRDFLAFDIRVDGVFEDTFRTLEVTGSFGIPHVPLLLVESFEKCLEISEDFLTHIPHAVHGLPPISGNKAEGVVIKPRINYMWGEKRVSLKKKSESFSETKKAPKKKQEYSNIEQAVMLVSSEYININRLNNLLSKHEQITKGDLGDLFKAFAYDVIADIIVDHPTLMSMIAEDRQKLIRGNISKKASAFARVPLLSKVSE